MKELWCFGYVVVVGEPKMAFSNEKLVRAEQERQTEDIIAVWKSKHYDLIFIWIIPAKYSSPERKYLKEIKNLKERNKKNKSIVSER